MIQRHRNQNVAQRVRVAVAILITLSLLQASGFGRETELSSDAPGAPGSPAQRDATSASPDAELYSPATVAHFSDRELEIPFHTRVSGAAPIHAYQLWYTTDSGKTWSPFGPVHRGIKPIPFLAPSDGVFGFKILPRDLAKRTPLPPQPGERADRVCVVDTTPPTIQVKRPVGLERLFAGTALVTEWEAFDAHLADQPVSIEWRTDQDPWRPIDEDEVFSHQGAFEWWAPLASGSFEFRLRAVDRAGNETIWTSPKSIEVVPFDGFRGARTLSADPYSAFRKFPIHYRVTNFQPHEVKQVEIWSRFERGPWTLNVDRTETPYLFEATRDGSYFFYLRVVDHNEKADRPAPGSDTRPDYRVVVDTHPPLGSLVVGSGSELISHQGGQLLQINWTVEEPNLPRNGVDLECSLDGGQTWRLLKTQLTTKAGRGSFTWRPPLLKSEALRLRIAVRDLAGNRSEIAATSRLQLINPRLDPTRTAEHHYRRALHLARLHVPGESGRRSQLRMALENLDIALTYDSEMAVAWHDRGVILTLLEDYPKALLNFVKATELSPGDLSFQFHLVRAHLRMIDSGLDPGQKNLDLAEAALARISPEAIYSQPPDKYRDLFNRYHVLKDDLEERRILD